MSSSEYTHTISEIGNEWLKEKSGFVKKSTLNKYEDILNLYIEPSLGDCTLSEVTNRQILDFGNELLVKGGANRQTFFSGYIFVEMELDEAEAFDKRLRKAKHKLLEVEGQVQPIKPHEEEYLLQLGGKEHIIRHSQGFRVDDMVRITSGSFRGYDGEIRKLDRHNRRASIVIPFMGRDIEVQMGLEIVENLTQKDISKEELLELGKSNPARLAIA